MRFLFDGHTLDIDRRELRRGTEPVALEPLVFDLLIYLVANRDHVVSKDDVLDSVWSGRIVSESALTTRIAAARRAIGDTGEIQKLIRTIPHKGFRFVGSVREELDAAIGDTETPDPESATTATLRPPDKPSIAVLPFTNTSPDPNHAFFADGIAEDIITDLSRDRALFVISRNSSFTYRGRTVDPKRVGRELGVRYLLEGSSRRVSGQIRVNVQLINTETGSHIWSERYDCPVESVFAVQDAITTAVVRAINPAISHTERQRAVRQPPESLSAWESWHRALEFLSKRDVSGLRDLLHQAVTLNPRFASAHAMLAFFYLMEATRGIGLPLPVSVRLAEAAARTAIELDPHSAIAHAMLGWTFGHQGDWVPAMQEAETAITLNVNDPWGYLSKGYALTFSGHPAEARHVLATAFRLDPYGPIVPILRHLETVCHYFERDYLTAEAVARFAIREHPENPRPNVMFAAALGQLGRTEEAQAALATAIAASSPVLRYITDSRPTHYRPQDHEHFLDGLRKAGWNG